MEVRNGDTVSSPLIGKYCGTSIPALLNSTGTKMFVKFYSDSDSVQSSGFSASYTSYLAGLFTVCPIPSDIMTPC